jgi:hypothetical protein
MKSDRTDKERDHKVVRCAAARYDDRLGAGPKPPPENFSCRHDPERGVVVGYFTGSLNKKSIKAYAREAARLLKKNRCGLFLNDLSHAAFDFSTMEIYDLSDNLATLGLGKNVSKRAILVSQKTPDHVFFENVCVNKGFNVLVFTDLREALAWLMH